MGGDWLDFEKKGSNAVDGGTGHFNVLITANTRLRVRLEGGAPAAVAPLSERGAFVRLGGQGVAERKFVASD